MDELTTKETFQLKYNITTYIEKVMIENTRLFVVLQFYGTFFNLVKP